MKITVFQLLRLFREKGLDEAQRDLDGFLHDISELTGDLHLPVSAGEQCLDKQDLPACRRPGKSGHNARILFLQDVIMTDRLCVDEFAHIFGCHNEGQRIFSLHHTHRSLPAKRIHPLFQAADTAFHRVLGDDGADGLFGHFQHLFSDTHGLPGFGQQMPSGDLELVGSGISRKLDHFHTVQQRLRNGVCGIGRADEHHIGKIIGHVHVVIRKAEILLGIKDLQQCAGRIAVIGDRQLIHLIQHHHRIGNAALVDPVHDPAGHRADVGTPVSPDLRLITDSAEADPYILTSQSPCDALANAGLAGSGRSDKQQDRPCLFLLFRRRRTLFPCILRFFRPVLIRPLFPAAAFSEQAALVIEQIHDSDLLQDPLFHLLETEVILVQDRLRLEKVDVIPLRRFPFQPGQEIKIIVEHAVLGGILAFLLHTAQDLVSLLAGRLVHPALRDLLLEPADIGFILRVHLIQFVLQILHLLFDRLLTVDLLVVLCLGIFRLLADLGDLQEFVQRFLHQIRPLRNAVLGQNLIFFHTGDTQPSGESHSDLTDRVPLHHVVLDHLPPFMVGNELQQCRLNLLQMLLLLRSAHIPDVGTAMILDRDLMVFIDLNIVQFDTAVCPDNPVSVRIFSRHDTLYADRVKTVRRQLLLFLLNLQEEQKNLIARIGLFAGDLFEKVFLKVKIDVRQHQCVIYRND